MTNTTEHKKINQEQQEQRSAILSAAAMIVIVAMLLGYSGYAWITMAKTVRATGVQLTASTADGLEISSGDIPWAESISIDLEDIVESQLTGYDKISDSFYLLPASGYSGVNGSMYSTGRAKSDGSAYEDTVFYEGHGIELLSGNYEGHYIDVPLSFRTSSANDQQLRLVASLTAFAPVDNNTDVAKTARAAFISDTLDTPSQGTQPLVYANSERGATDWVVTQSDYPSEQQKQTPLYMTFADGLSNDVIIDLPAADYSGGQIKYNPVSIVVRIWIEGQDSYCVSSIGNKAFSVNFGFRAVDK